MNPKIFKANDIRGKYPQEVNEKTIFEIAKALRGYFGLKAKIVIGRDDRLSSPSLYKEVFRGLGGKIIEAKIITTPMLYFLVNKLGADGGIMVTASHNPKNFNGLKIVGKKASPISGLEIGSFASTRFVRPATRSLVLADSVRLLVGHHAESVAGVSDKRYQFLYISFLKKFLKLKRPVKVVFDCSNGTTGLVLKKLFPRAIFINNKLNGNFPAHGPDPMAGGAMEQLQSAVKKHKADLGIIFDSDGDRVFFADDKGKTIDAEDAAFILAENYKQPFVISADYGYRMKQYKTIISKVGRYFLKKKMIDKKASFGAERSGHYYFKDFNYSDSGIFAAIQMINFISGKNEKIPDYLNKLPKLYRFSKNFKVSDKEKIINRAEKFYKNKKIKVSSPDGLVVEAKDFRFCLRPSNTENLVRLNAEALSKEALSRGIKELKQIL
ncbi:MAG: hypothetical protein PHN74_02905 [Candidatus Pacebacteria bacterium]|nr:hypothetical protein [Candidatus Paceibacterota bacterium]